MSNISNYRQDLISPYVEYKQLPEIIIVPYLMSRYLVPVERYKYSVGIQEKQHTLKPQQLFILYNLEKLFPSQQ